MFSDFNYWRFTLLTLPYRFGFSFLGAKFSEAKLIGMAYAFEQRTKARDKMQPYIVPKTELEDVVGK
jgi:amidase